MQKPGRSADRVYSELIERLMAGSLKSGHQLNEQLLAEEFGVSRTPVREALQRLSALGLTERGTRRALVIRRGDVAGMQNLFEAVTELESLLSRMAALRMTTVERQLLARLADEGDREDIDYAAANERFHAAIHAGASNPVLAATLAEMSLRTLAWRGSQFRARSNRIESSRMEHRAICSAVMTGDVEMAANHMRSHVAASFRGILTIVQTIDDR